MSATLELSGKLRQEKGKGPSGRMRGEGLLPGVLYGQKDNLSLSVNFRDLKKIIDQNGKNAIIDLALEGDPAKHRKVILKDFQTHPLKTNWTHIDFMEIDMNKLVRVGVPVRLTGTSPGIKEGGIVNQIIKRLDVECLPADIPGGIEVSMDAIGIGQSVHVSDLKLPGKVKIFNRPTDAVVTVYMAKEEVVKPAAEAAPAEGAAAEGQPAAAAAPADAKAEKGDKAAAKPAKGKDGK